MFTFFVSGDCNFAEQLNHCFIKYPDGSEKRQADQERTKVLKTGSPLYIVERIACFGVLNTVH